MSKRKWLPTLGELVDRLSIHQLKEVFIPENKKNYAKEMNDMVHDIDLIIKENNGTKDTKTSFKISALGGISSAAGLGAKDGLKYALIIT